jgi:hypothetical protein
MKRTIRLTESQLISLINRVINEQEELHTQNIPTVTVTAKKTQNIPEVTVTPKDYLIKLKKPTMDGFYELLYIKKTGELLGDGKKENRMVTIQANLSKEQVIQWLERNKIKVFK